MINTLARPALKKFGSRAFASAPQRFNPIPVDIEHYTSGWHIEDLSDFTRQGKYSVQTYNQISTKVRNVEFE